MGDGAPFWDAETFPHRERSGRFHVLASGFDADVGTLPLRADFRVLAAMLSAGATTEYRLGATRHAYLVPSRGAARVNGVSIGERDGIAITDEELLRVEADGDVELVLADAD